MYIAQRRYEERDIGRKHAESVYHYTDAVARGCPATGRVRLVRQASFYCMRLAKVTNKYQLIVSSVTLISSARRYCDLASLLDGSLVC